MQKTLLLDDLSTLLLELQVVITAWVEGEETTVKKNEEEQQELCDPQKVCKLEGGRTMLYILVRSASSLQQQFLSSRYSLVIIKSLSIFNSVLKWLLDSSLLEKFKYPKARPSDFCILNKIIVSVEYMDPKETYVSTSYVTSSHFWNINFICGGVF